MISLVLTLSLFQQANNPTGQSQQGPIPAFPNSPKAPPPKVQDLAVPPAPVTPGVNRSSNIDFSSPLSAQEAVRIALHLQPSLGVQAGAIQTQQGRTRQTGSNENLQFILGGGYDNIQSIAGTTNTVLEAPNAVVPLGVSPLYPVSFAAELRQLLFDFNLTRNLVRQSEALERSFQANLTTAQLNLSLNVSTAYFNYANALRQVKVNEANVENRQRQLDLASARLSSGIGQPSDLVTAQTSKSQGILLLNQSRDTAEQARIQLLQLMGIDPLTPLRITDETAPTSDTDNAQALTQTALRSRPEVKSAVEAVAAARYGLSAAKAVDLPSIYAEVGAGLGGSNFPLKDNTANFGVGIQFPLFDGGNRDGAIRAARGQITTADSNLQTAALQVRTDVASAYMALKSAEQRVLIANNEVFNAQEAVRVAEGRYSAGIGLFLDVTTAQGLLLNAQTDQSNAQNSLDQARTQIRRATGQMMSEARSGG